VSGWVDLKTWKRLEHYRLFRKYERPFFSVTVDVDVTTTWNRCRKPGAPSFFLSSVFLMLNAVNDVEAFRLRLRPRGVWRHDRIGVGPTIRRPDETFGFARFEPAETLEEFVGPSSAAIARAMSATRLEPSEMADDVVYHSVLPWFRFTSYTNALPGGDSIPRIVFGRVERAGGRMRMPVAVEVHHALVDGLDVARFFERFGRELERGRLSPRRRTKERDR
jgi:chloramphenicol O-acetyltransferase type A